MCASARVCVRVGVFTCRVETNRSVLVTRLLRFKVMGKFKVRFSITPEAVMVSRIMNVSQWNVSKRHENPTQLDAACGILTAGSLY